jgi:hypothetical protein
VTDNYEALLCAALLNSPELIGTVQLESKAFKDKRYRTLFEVLNSLKDGEINPAVVHQELVNRGWKRDETATLLNALTGQDEVDLEVVEFYSSKVNESYGKRTLLNKLGLLTSQVKDATIPLEDNIANLSQLAISSQMGATLKDYTANGIYVRLIDSLEKEEPPAFHSGLDLVDSNLASEGMKPRQIWFFTGGYKQYKSRVIMNICNAALDQGKSVAYFGLEDDDITFTTALMAAKFSIPEKSFEAFYQKKENSYSEGIVNAINWMGELGNRWKVYDQTSRAGEWKQFPAMVMADKLKYGTDLVVLDHIQMWSEDNKELAEINKMLMRVSAQADVALAVISQMSNEVLWSGSNKNMLHTKGSGSFGALAHVGIEVFKDSEKSDFYLNKFPVIRTKLVERGMDKFVNKAGLLSEIKVSMKVVRKGNAKNIYCIFDAYSGKLLLESFEASVIE